MYKLFNNKHGNASVHLNIQAKAYELGHKSTPEPTDHEIKHAGEVGGWRDVWLSGYEHWL